ncbi:MAG: 2-isopropylmalate synthase [Solirubrobacterales bacterium]
MTDISGNQNDAENRVHIFDTTLRDGEQSPGISLNTAEKVEIAQQLARLGVDVIEAGFPITSPGDFEAVEQIARRVEGPTICGLARAQKGDIEAAWNAIRDSERPRIHTFISTSDIHIEHQMRNTREDVKIGAKAAVAHAKSYCDDIEFSPMDATRADVEFTAEVCAIAVAEGATVVNIPDTVGYTTPEEYSGYFAKLYEFAPELKGVELSVHCHDDLGLAVANSYAGVLAGARQVECAINGIGERAGNCSLEEIAMLIRVREDAHGLTTGINTKEIARTSRMISRLTGYVVQPNKAIVGRNAFAHESGIHQDGVLKERSTFEIMDATEVGLDSNQIVLGKHSGRHALKDALEQLGFTVDGGALNQAFKRFKEIADKKKQVTALDLEAIVSDEMREREESHELSWFEVESGSEREPKARVAVRMPSGEDQIGEASGDGPVDSIFSAIQKATETEAELREYHVAAVTGGDDALGSVTVMLRSEGRTATGQGVATDILEASARAYVRALSNLLDGVAISEAEAATADAASEMSGP